LRLDLWTRTHIERLLAPLFVLGAAEDITGLARGIAYQLVEALGVLERSKVADDLKGFEELQRLASSGRTSFPVDKEVQRSLYRTIGYRVCGERAVRVDILERLADLIRPALSWRPNSHGSKPAGAFEGIGFTVTQAM